MAESRVAEHGIPEIFYSYIDYIFLTKFVTILKVPLYY